MEHKEIANERVERMIRRNKTTKALKWAIFILFDYVPLLQKGARLQLKGPVVRLFNPLISHFVASVKSHVDGPSRILLNLEE